ncbi:FkbM family methyltransferase [Candidatus Woesearchaeota archaeon]|nr:FkbM family methyltransferase [Candidatus Woesearchaeota archaeon]
MLKTALFSISRFFYCIYEITGNKHFSRKICIVLLRNFLKITLKRIITKYFNKNITREKFLDFKIVFDTYENFHYLFQEIFVHQYYYFKTNKKNPNIIDCGANIGMSILFFKWIYPEAKIIAFEPNPKSFELLKKNIEQNKLKEITLVNAAVCDVEKNMKFSVNGSQLSFLKTVKDKNEEVFVRAVKLSKYIDKTVDLLKIDIEGAEGKVISEIKSKLKLVNQMVFEYHERGNINSLSEILSNLKEFKLVFAYSSMHKVPTKYNWFIIMVYCFRDVDN